MDYHLFVAHTYVASSVSRITGTPTQVDLSRKFGCGVRAQPNRPPSGPVLVGWSLDPALCEQGVFDDGCVRMCLSACAQRTGRQ